MELIYCIVTFFAHCISVSRTLKATKCCSLFTRLTHFETGNLTRDAKSRPYSEIMLLYLQHHLPRKIKPRLYF